MRLRSCKFLLTALHCKHETSPFAVVVGWVFVQLHCTIHHVGMSLFICAFFQICSFIVWKKVSKRRGCGAKVENHVYTYADRAEIEKIRVHDSTFSGFEYRAKESTLEITCIRQEDERRFEFRFENVVGVKLQSCAFWGGGNNVLCVYAEDHGTLLEAFRRKQAENEALYSGSKLAKGTPFITVTFEINSGDTLSVCCETVRVSESDADEI